MPVREGLLVSGQPYLAFGSGPPLVAFSALTPTHDLPRGWERRALVRPLAPLARRFTVYAVNRRPGLPPGCSMPEISDHYADAIEAEFGGPVHVHGTSTGGSVALQFAIDHPRLVRRLVLVATACRLGPTGHRVQRRLIEAVEAGRSRSGWAAVGSVMGSTRAGRLAWTAAMWLTAEAMTPEDAADLLRTLRAEDAFDAGPHLHRITAPTLLLAGQGDRGYSPELFRETVDGIPSARLNLVPGKGHAAVVLSATRDAAVVREIIDFLTQPSGRRAP